MQTSHSAQKTIYLLFIILFQLQLNAKSIFYESRFDESQVCFEKKKDFLFLPENMVMACAITSVPFGTQCNDNGTTSVNDDFYTISINPIGDMLGSTYDVSGNYGITNFSETGISYGMSTVLSVNVPIGIPTDITVTDGTDSNCTYTFRVGSPAECSSPFECWAIADQGDPDQLYYYSSATDTWTKAPNSTGVNGIESVAYDPNNSILYSANRDRIGTVDVSTGVFTPIAGSTAIDTVYGPNGPHNIADIDGMSYDLYTDILWASERRGGAGIEDYIFQIDPLTGQPIANAFGPGIDYIVSPAVYDSVIMQLVYDVDDIAIDPVTGNLYLVANQGGAGGVLVVLDKTDGSIIEVVGNFAGVDDIESLGFFNSGNLFGSTGDNGPDSTDNNKFFLIDKFTAMLDEQSPIDPTGTDVDFEACDCLSGSINTINGKVFLDLNKNSTEDSEPGLDSIVISLYRDIDSDSMFTAGVDILLDTVWTDTNGMYSFPIASIGDFLVIIDQTTLPTDSEMTTDNLLPSGFYSTNQTNLDNNFGVCICPDIEVLAFALQPTCIDGVPQSDGYLQLSQVIGGDKYHYSTGSSFNNAGGANDYSNATSLIGATYPVQFANGLSNPTGSQDYTVRVYSGSDVCYTDITFTMNEQDCQMGCECEEFLYVNDPSFDITHKFEVNPDGSVGNEIFSSGTNPWLPEGLITNAHGVVGDVNGNLFISQIDTDPTALYKVACDGTVLSTDFFPDWNRTLNLATIGTTLYSIGREPTGGDYMIWAHDVCNNAPLDSIATPAAPSGNTTAWDISVGQDGELYFSQTFSASGDDHCVYTVDQNLTNISQVFCLPNVPGHRILGIDQDDCGNFYTVINSNSSTIIYKVAPNGTVIDSIADTTLDGSGFAGGWGLIYNETSDKLYIGTLGDDCVAVVDAGGCSGDLTYENALGVPHTPGAYSKAVDIVKQCCPTNNNIVIDTTVCNVNVPLFLRDIIGCDQAICEASWSEDPANIGMYFDECTELVTTDPEGCGTFTLESDGTAPNSVCGAFKITLNIDVIIAQIVSVRPDTSFCEGGSAELYATINNLDNLTYQWQSSTTSCATGFSNISSGATDSLYVATPTDTTYYRLLTSTDGNCSDGSCTDTSACIVLNVIPNPVLTVTDQTICEGESVDLVELFSSSLSGNITYHAGTPPSAANELASTTVSPSTTRIYYGLVVTPEECSDTTMVTITVNPVDTTDITASICQGETYTFNSQNLATAGTYLDTLMQINGCDSIIRLELTVISTPDLATNNDEICVSESINLATLVTDNNSTAGSATFHSAYPTSAGNELSATTVSPTGTTEYYVFKGGATCNDVDSILITVNPIDTTDFAATICQGDTYTFNNQNLAIAGTYLDTLMQTNGCDSIIRLALSIAPTPDLVALNDTICDGGTVDLTTLVSDNNSLPGTVTYHSAFPTTAANELASTTVTPSTTTKYYIFKQGTSCNDTDSLTVVVNPNPTGGITPQNENCAENNNGAATAGVTGGTAPYSYLWSTTQTTQGISGLASGMYTVTITDSAGCMDTVITTITQPDTLKVTFVKNDGTCEDANGSATVSATGGTPSYNYLWEDGETVDNISAKAAGTYTVTVTDANGCQKIDSITINNIGMDNTSSITYTGCQGDGYSITVEGSVYNEANPIGMETISNGNQFGCDSVITISLTFNNSIVITPFDSTICKGATVDLTGLFSTTGGTMTYHSGTPPTAANELSTTIISNITTTQVYYATAGGGACADTAMVTITPVSPDLTLNYVTDNSGIAADTVLCHGETAFFGGNVTFGSGTSPYTYEWTADPSGNAVLTNDTDIFASGVFTNTTTDSVDVTIQLVVTDDNGCTDTIAFDVQVQPQLQIDSISVFDFSGSPEDHGICFGDSISFKANVSPEGNYTYSWSEGSTTDSIRIAPDYNNVSTPYYVTVTDSYGCDVEQFTSAKGFPELLATVDYAPSCSPMDGDTLIYNVSGGVPGATGYVFDISTEPLNVISFSPLKVLVNEPAGTIITTIIDDEKGCGPTLTITVPADNYLAVAMDSNAACSGDNGTATANVTGGIAPYSYAWSNGGSTATISNLAVGTYTATVTDANGCQIIDNIEVTAGVCNFDVALKKEVLTPAPYQGGDDVTFEITVYNQGELNATNLIVHDYIPSGLALNDANWNEVSPQVAVDTVALLVPGDSAILFITLRIHSSFQGLLVNNAEIVAADGGIDQDSPLSNTNDGSSNELGSDDNINDDGPGTPGLADMPTDEDDYDPAFLQVECPTPKCLPIQVNQN